MKKQTVSKQTATTAREMIQSLTSLKLQEPSRKRKHRRRSSLVRTDGRRMRTLSLLVEESTVKIIDGWCEQLKCHKADLLRTALECFSERFGLEAPEGLWNVQKPRRKLNSSNESE